MTLATRENRSPAHARPEGRGAGSRHPEGRRVDDRPEPRSVSMRAVDLLLTVAALGGVVCIIAVIMATVFDITLIMFKTGSMSPTIPAGSLAVVREIPATEVRVGDIVTVDREDQLPITHRVVAVSTTTDGQTSITMRGDANTADDPAPYIVDSVRTVVYSVPGLAAVIIALSHPLVLGGITLGAALLVTWAFWPRAEKRRRHRATGGAAAVAVALVVVPSVTSAPPAHADAPEWSVVHSRYLTLESLADDEAMGSLTPGRPVPWQVGVSVRAPEPGIVRLGISAEGTLSKPGTLDVEIRECAEAWVAGVCGTGDTVWLPQQDLAAATVPTNVNGSREIGSMYSTDKVWLQVAVSLPEAARPGMDATIAIHAWGGSGELGDGSMTADSASQGFLASTGGITQVPALALAVAAVLAGLALAGIAQLTRLIGRRDDE
ncbi:signal peptidase [Conyzicola lurida]|uniref:Signal peptidase I n=1 Tax=Conyzicola lurida TaxID=1172621 RepID=A0A841AG31_9MICO|nr:signal peptidase I [Conyzicola lurida]MBB5842760.1 signal peptidase [Conyzicola lurida]